MFLSIFLLVLNFSFWRAKEMSIGSLSKQIQRKSVNTVYIKHIRNLNLVNEIRQHTRCRREDRSWCRDWCVVASGAWDRAWKFEILAGDIRKERSLRRSCLRGAPLVGNLSWRRGWQSFASGCCKIPVKRCRCVKILSSEFAYSVVFAEKRGISPFRLEI